MTDKSKSIIGISVGSSILTIYYVYFICTSSDLDIISDNNFLTSTYLLGLVILLYGSAYYARSKGYTFLYGFVSIMFPFGLFLLMILKNKTINPERIASPNGETANANSP